MSDTFGGSGIFGSKSWIEITEEDEEEQEEEERQKQEELIRQQQLQQQQKEQHETNKKTPSTKTTLKTPTTKKGSTSLLKRLSNKKSTISIPIQQKGVKSSPLKKNNQHRNRDGEDLRDVINREKSSPQRNQKYNQSYNNNYDNNNSGKKLSRYEQYQSKKNQQPQHQQQQQQHYQQNKNEDLRELINREKSPQQQKQQPFDLRSIIESEKRKSTSPNQSPSRQPIDDRNRRPQQQEQYTSPNSTLSSKFDQLSQIKNTISTARPDLSPNTQNQQHQTNNNNSPRQQQQTPQRIVSTPNGPRRNLEDLTPYSSPIPSTPTTPTSRTIRRPGDQYQNSPSQLNSPLRSNLQNQLDKASKQSDNPQDEPPIIGTCMDYEKKYLRLTTKPNPALIRPESVLKAWYPMLIRKYINTKNYDYTIDQLKSIRQDLVVQHIRNSFTLEVYEGSAKVTLENNDFTEFGQCLSQIKELYFEGVTNNNRVEFLSYDLLFTLLFNEKELPLMEENENIKNTLNIIKSVITNNYHEFSKYYVKCFNQEKILLDKILSNRLREYTLSAMMKSFRPSLHLSHLERELIFSSQESLLTYLESNPSYIVDREKQLLMCIKK
eukprot:gene639-792_t